MAKYIDPSSYNLNQSQRACGSKNLRLLPQKLPKR